MHNQMMSMFSNSQSQHTKHSEERERVDQTINEAMVDTHGKKLFYVTACGRSGTTLLGFVLGNIPGVIDLGEVNEYVRFDGRPNGFGSGTANYEFWDRVLKRLRSRLGDLDFDRLRRLHRVVDYHPAMLLQILTGRRYRRTAVAEQRIFLTALYQSIFDECDGDIVVDSSKYPSRLWHLSQILPQNSLYAIHLKRKASSVISAMRSGGQGKPKSLPAAIAYFLGVEFLISSVFGMIDTQKKFGMPYEKLVSEPENVLTGLGKHFQIDVAPVIEKIDQGLPLDSGFIFNGNRMRMQERVIFQKEMGVRGQ